MKTKRVLLVSCAIIALCMTIITGMTYSLFTDYYSVRNHLVAGRLNVTLQRTYLEYRVIDIDGVNRVHTDESVYDFTNTTSNNMFGMSAQEIRITPTSYFEADLRILNDNSEGANYYSNVAFDYSVEIVLLSGYNELAKQMQVTVTNNEGVSTKMRLVDVVDGKNFMAGKLEPGQEAHNFTVRVDFLNDVDYSDMVNNFAQDQGVVFDLVVRAVQSN